MTVKRVYSRLLLGRQFNHLLYTALKSFPMQKRGHVIAWFNLTHILLGLSRTKTIANETVVLSSDKWPFPVVSFVLRQNLVSHIQPWGALCYLSFDVDENTYNVQCESNIQTD